MATVRLYRRHGRQVYAVIAILLILSFVAVPLLQSGQTTRFFERYAFADEQPVTGQPAPLPPNAPIPERHSPTSNLRSPTSSPPTTCGDGDPSIDTDGDGLNDRDENCLGTDPGHADSDRDTITDTLELDGFEFPAASGQMWYGDPLKADSNEDGLLDSYEWPDPYGSAPEWDTDGDGIPAPWDDDNDGDGVPDSLDLAPYAYGDYGDSFSLSTQGGGFDGYQFIEIQVQPQDPAHLRYSLSALDWPYDYRGQVRDLNSSKEDVRLVPILQITTNTAPDQEMAANYGVSMVENDDGTLHPLRRARAVGQWRADHGLCRQGGLRTGEAGRHPLDGSPPGVDRPDAERHLQVPQPRLAARHRIGPPRDLHRLLPRHRPPGQQGQGL